MTSTHTSRVMLAQLFALAGLCLLGCGTAIAGPALPSGYEQALATRHDAYLREYAKRKLEQGPNPTTWVDSERWCIAHACLVAKERLPEANQYLREVQPVSLMQGLIADTDVQFPDLLRTYLAFKDDARLTDAAKRHLEDLFKKWGVPNTDRNDQADDRYEWPQAYTENHSLSILTVAYLIDVALGRDRAPRKNLLERFLADRARWGWSETHSPQYGMTTAKPLTCLIDFAPDPSVKQAATMAMDLLLIEFFNHSAGRHRGVPFIRGAGMERSNNSNSFNPLVKLWFGDKAEDASPFLLHAILSSYRPPQAAFPLVTDSSARGSYTMHKTATHGFSRLRIPMVFHVTPNVTLCSATGYGHYYRGNYWSASFASDPDHVISGRYLPVPANPEAIIGRRNLYQRQNVMAVFGQVNWHGKLDPKTEGNLTLGGDGKAMVVAIKLAEDLHVVMVGDLNQMGGPDGFKKAAEALKPAFTDGVVIWTAPDGVQVKMINRREGNVWRFVEARENDKLVASDRNMLYQSPWLQSVRGSGVIEVKAPGVSGKWIYDSSDPAAPKITRSNEGFAPLPADNVAAPMGMELTFVPPGDFPMGSPVTEGRDNERPQHWVDLRGFYISRTEVTIGQYKQFLSENSGYPKPPEWYAKDWGKSDQHPQTWVTWHEAKAFCEWLSKKTGKKFRLPSEAQWEKAAKGFEHRQYTWGGEYDGSQAGNKNEEFIDQVGKKPGDVGPFGTLDMAGNAWEWCSDWFEEDTYARRVSESNKDGKAPFRTDPRDPEGPVTGKRKALRSAGWNFDPETFRCAYRTGLEPDKRSVHIGFRVVCEP